VVKDNVKWEDGLGLSWMNGQKKKKIQKRNQSRINYSFHSTTTLNGTLFKLVVESAIPS
jgi:hypothetical protein